MIKKLLGKNNHIIDFTSKPIDILIVNFFINFML